MEILSRVQARRSSRDLPLHSAILEIKRIYKKSFCKAADSVFENKSWRVLLEADCVSDSPRAIAVAEFRLLTGHDCLGAHLFRFNLTSSPLCALCDSGQIMDAAHLDVCSALKSLN
ncbi:hypothetical protein X975_11437, partial [Stegodyphus mimosarum]